MKVKDIREMPPEHWRPGVETRMRVSAASGAAQLCIFEQWVAPGTGAPTHVHPVEEVLTVREGEAEMWIDAQQVIVTAGQSLIVRRGASTVSGIPATSRFISTRCWRRRFSKPRWKARRNRCGDGRRRELLTQPPLWPVQGYKAGHDEQRDMRRYPFFAFLAITR